MDRENVNIDRLRSALGAEGLSQEEIEQFITVVHPVDLVYLIEDLPRDSQVQVLQSLDGETRAIVLSELEEEVAERIVKRLGDEVLVDVIEEMPPDDAADIMGMVTEEKAQALLDQVEEEHRTKVESLISYGEESAGGIMTTEFMSVSSDLTAGEAISKIQGVVRSEEKETINYVYVVGDQGKLIGVMSIRDLIGATPATAVRDVMTSGEELRSVQVDTDQEDVARLIQKYNLGAVPVLDRHGRLQGVVTVDDILDVIEEEVSEDMFLLAGTEAVNPGTESVIDRVRKRVPFLLITFAMGGVLGKVLHGFEDTIGMQQILVYFFPVVMAMGGNVGLQSSTIVVRGLATGEVVTSRFLKVVMSEMTSGIVVGCLFGVLAGLLSVMFGGSFQIAIVICVSMACSIGLATTAGTIIPLTCERVGIDPAIAAGPFLLALNDVLSVLVYFSFASWLLHAFPIT